MIVTTRVRVLTAAAFLAAAGPAVASTQDKAAQPSPPPAHAAPPPPPAVHAAIVQPWERLFSGRAGLHTAATIRATTRLTTTTPTRGSCGIRSGGDTATGTATAIHIRSTAAADTTAVAATCCTARSS